MVVESFVEIVFTLKNKVRPQATQPYATQFSNPDVFFDRKLVQK